MRAFYHSGKKQDHAKTQSCFFIDYHIKHAEKR